MLTAESSGREGNILGRKSLRFLGSSLGVGTAMMPSPAAMLRRFTSSVMMTCAQPHSHMQLFLYPGNGEEMQMFASLHQLACLHQ